MKSILDVEVSCFANYNTPSNPRSVNLYRWLTNTKHRDTVLAIRAELDKKERARKKSTLPATTPCGEFTYRHESALVRHSGIICLDIDFKGNEGISNYADLKREICQIKNVAYCGLSVSGTGFYVLIPITHPERHREHFNALRDLFQKRYNIRIDNTPDVSRLRGYSYDPDGYFNHQAHPFNGLYTPAPIPARNDNPVYKYPPEGVATVALLRCIRLVEGAQDGEKHVQLNKASYLAGGYITEGILNEAEAIAALENAISRKSNVSDLQAAFRTIRDGIRDGKQHPFEEKPATPTSLKDENVGVSNPIIVTSIAEQAANPGSILKPDESQLERLTSKLCDHYPAEWDEPNPPGKTPKISSQSFHDWQKNNKFFGQMGLASLSSQQPLPNESQSLKQQIR